MLVPSRIEIFLLSTSGKRTSCKCGHCSKDLDNLACFRGIVRSFTAHAELTAMTWSFLLSNDAILKLTFIPLSSTSALFTVVRESLLGVPLMFSNFTREGSTIVMSDPESIRPYVVI